MRARRQSVEGVLGNDGPGRSMNETFDQLTDLTAALASLVADRVAPVIGIDGLDGVGKTTMAKRLAHLLGAQHLELDDFLCKDRGTYACQIRCDELHGYIGSIDGPIVIDGICLLAVVKRCEVRLDAHVYLKRISEAGNWYDADICLAQKPVNELIEELEQSERDYADAFDDAPPGAAPPLDIEKAEYHRDYDPVQKADYIFELNETTLREWRNRSICVLGQGF